MTLGITKLRCYADRHYAECHMLFAVMLNVIMLSVVTPFIRTCTNTSNHFIDVYRLVVASLCGVTQWP
jgi:hypothetical protein